VGKVGNNTASIRLSKFLPLLVSSGGGGGGGGLRYGMRQNDSAGDWLFCRDKRMNFHRLTNDVTLTY